MEYILSSVLLCVGLYAIVVKRNILKTVMGVAIMGYAINLFLILAGFRAHADVPILSNDASRQYLTVDPTVQAMVLATVTIGMAITFLLTSLAMKLYEKYETLDITEIKKLKG